MSFVVLITGAATGIGNLTARALAQAGHTVYASMRNIDGRNAGHANDLLDLGRREGLDLRVVELDVQSESSADAAVATIVGEAGQLDTVVHNAGHLYVGYVEAFTPEDIQHLFDINAVSIQRVNRAVLPHMRARRSGTLLYVGSTTSVVVPPFLGPYVASKFAGDVRHPPGLRRNAARQEPAGLTHQLPAAGPRHLGGRDPRPSDDHIIRVHVVEQD